MISDTICYSKEEHKCSGCGETIPIGDILDAFVWDEKKDFYCLSCVHNMDMENKTVWQNYMGGSNR
jgi:hypothetical protein